MPILRISTLFTIIFIACASPAVAQDIRCGTAPPETVTVFDSQNRASEDGNLTVLVKFHLLRSDNGQLPFSEGWIYNAIAAMNAELDTIGIELKPCGPPTEIDDSSLSFSSVSTFNEFVQENEVPGYLNIYLKEYTGMGSAGAYTHFPGGYDHIVFGSGGVSMATAVHEVGHFFSLLHTHEGYNVPAAAEYVDGSNCDTAGDYICDTPASPNLGLSGLLDSECNYTGDLTDPLGVPYAPSADNHMSYAHNQCREHFTPGQYNRMAGSRDLLRFYMVQGDGSPGIYGLAEKYCITDSTVYSPDVQPTGGELWINGEAADGFVPASLGAGNHTLTYFPPEGSLSNSTGPKYTSLNPMWFGTEQRASFWQAFRPDDTGKPDELALRLDVEPATTVNIALFEGQGVDGNLIWQGTQVTENGSGVQWHHFPLDTALTPLLVADNNYTFAVDFAGDSAMVSTAITFSAYAGPPSDSGFLRYTHALRMPGGTCDCAVDSVQVTIKVNNPVEIDQPNLRSAYCVEDSSVIALEPGNPNVEGDMLLNGEPATSFVPSELGVGSYTATFVPSELYNNGCVQPSTRALNVVAPPELDLPDTLCNTDDALLLEVLGAAGSFTLDGQPATAINPWELSPGNYLLEHNFFNPLDTAFWIDTQYNGSGQVYHTSIETGATLWQSFVPDNTGRLDRLELYLNNFSDTAVVEVSLVEGEGPGGALLASGVDSLLTDDPPMDEYFESISPMVYADSTYTVVVNYVSGNSGSWLRQINGAYEPGISNLHEEDGSDYIFKLNLMEIYDCGGTDSHAFTLLDCLTVGSHEQTASFKLYPNPASGEVWVEQTTGVALVNITLRDATGRLVKDWQLSSDHSRLDLTGFAPGWYVITLQNDHELISRSLLIR